MKEALPFKFQEMSGEQNARDRCLSSCWYTMSLFQLLELQAENALQDR